MAAQPQHPLPPTADREVAASAFTCPSGTFDRARPGRRALIATGLQQSAGRASLNLVNDAPERIPVVLPSALDFSSTCAAPNQPLTDGGRADRVRDSTRQSVACRPPTTQSCIRLITRSATSWPRSPPVRSRPPTPRSATCRSLPAPAKPPLPHHFVDLPQLGDLLSAELDPVDRGSRLGYDRWCRGECAASRRRRLVQTSTSRLRREVATSR